MKRLPTLSLDGHPSVKLFRKPHQIKVDAASSKPMEVLAIRDGKEHPITEPAMRHKFTVVLSDADSVEVRGKAISGGIKAHPVRPSEVPDQTPVSIPLRGETERIEEIVMRQAREAVKAALSDGSGDYDDVTIGDLLQTMYDDIRDEMDMEYGLGNTIMLDDETEAMFTPQELRNRVKLQDKLIAEQESREAASSPEPGPQPPSTEAPPEA